MIKAITKIVWDTSVPFVQTLSYKYFYDTKKFI